MTYRASLKDIRFCLDHTIGIQSLYNESFDADLRDAVLDAAGALAQDVLAPLNRVGDLNPSRLENGQVIIPEGFATAISAFAEGGWYGITAPESHGGQALPKVLEQACYDMFHGANMAFTLLPTLSQGAIEALSVHGTEAQKDLYLPRLISGEWSGTMNLTEPQAGSDLAALTTKAEPLGNGRYALTGQKIFITWGDHEAVDNIIHLVLARLPDAPAGSKGISLFICPKFRLKPDGSRGDRNAARAVSLEHKMGIHASPTCVMMFEGAEAELVGEPHGGLKAMFTMMNAARLAVGMQGVGLCDAATQMAISYAKDRKQGVSMISGAATSIFDHPDVRLMLGLMKAKTDAARAIGLLCATAIDQKHQSEGDLRLRWQRREDFLVPIAKAWATDAAVDVSSLAVQVHGGMGFIEEAGVAQYYRDARIAPIYEGTNGIQAADLVGRKLGHDAKAAIELIEDIKADMARLSADFTAETEALSDAIAAFEAASNYLIEQKNAAPLDVAAGAKTYLTLAGDLVGGWMLARAASSAKAALTDGHADAAYLQDKIASFQLFAQHVLSHAHAHKRAIAGGFAPLALLSLEVN